MPACVTVSLRDPVADHLDGRFEFTSQPLRSPSGANQGDAQTIWRRKAGGYGGLDFGMVDTSSSKGQVSTKSGQLQFPQVTVQTCIVHLIRRSLAYASYKERRVLAGALKTIYRAPTRAAAEETLDSFEAGPWGEKYPAIVRSWRSAWEQVVPFFAFSQPIRRAVYTTNAIERLNSTVRRAVRTRGHFPNDRAATKLIYLALRGVERKCRAPPLYWHQVRPELAIRFGDRFVVEPS